MNRRMIVWACLVVMGVAMLPAVSWSADGRVYMKPLNQALYFAAARNDISMVASLRDKGADVNATVTDIGLIAEKVFGMPMEDLVRTTADYEHWPLLTWMVYFENEEMVRILIKSGAKVNKSDQQGTMPIHWAAWTGNYPITKLLIQNGANPRVLDYAGRSPLDWALMNNQADVVRLLPKVSAPAPLDSDRDGVPNHLDRCPGTPIGAKVDNRGCWIVAYANFFDYDKDFVKPDYLPHIEKAAEVLLANPELVVVVGGHTDSHGSYRYNMDLGYRRARNVTQLLIKFGVPPERLKVKSYGESRPIASNATYRGRAQNRRVELNIWQPGAME